MCGRVNPSNNTSGSIGEMLAVSSERRNVITFFAREHKHREHI